MSVKNIKNAFDEENQSNLDEARLNRAELDARVKKFEASLKRTNVQPHPTNRRPVSWGEDALRATRRFGPNPRRRGREK